MNRRCHAHAWTVFAAALPWLVVPGLFWVSGFDFDQRGEKALACAILTLGCSAFAGLLTGIAQHAEHDR